MKWIKKGFICSHETLNLSWFKKNTMVPVPLLIDNSTLRIFLTMCDSENVGRIGYVDVNPENPQEIIAYSKEPSLDIGVDGAYDDSGVLPSAIFTEQDKKYMFYSAYQKQAKVPYSILSGIAEIKNDGSMTRLSNVPILERTNDEMFIRSAIYCIKAKGKYRIYYSSGNSWMNNGIKTVPSYDIKMVESDDLLNWSTSKAISSISLQGDEYGLTTPNVFVTENGYEMTYAIRSISKGYRMGYATSPDGINWTRLDNQMQIDISESGWDSEMVCFGNIFKVKNKTYMFYCGNHYGMAGMGYAELQED